MLGNLVSLMSLVIAPDYFRVCTKFLNFSKFSKLPKFTIHLFPIKKSATNWDGPFESGRNLPNSVIYLCGARFGAS